MRQSHWAYIFILLLSFQLSLPLLAKPVRIKDLIRIRGVRNNQLIGYGIVVGLPGTGDSPGFLATQNSLMQTLKALGVPLQQEQIYSGNIASVIVTAKMPPFARIGDSIPIRISSIGDASNLEGGTLLFTQLKGLDGKTYALAQGATSGGLSMAGGAGGNGNPSTAPKTIALSHGATIEREFEQTFYKGTALEISLVKADFTTASRVTAAINRTLGTLSAKPKNAKVISIEIPKRYQTKYFDAVDFISMLEQIRVEPDVEAKVVINERSGTVVAGGNVQILPVAISHGTLQIELENKKGHVGEVKDNSSVGELVKALNAFGAAPKDLSAILKSLHRAGALKAELIVE